jgi:hypothetical protein
MTEQQIRDALRGAAEAPGPADEQAAWRAIQARVAGEAGRRGARTALVAVGLALAGAAAAAVIVTAGDDGQPVEVGPADTTLGNLPQPPLRPIAVVVEVDGTQRLDLYDADTGALVTAGLAESAHSLSDLSITSDGTVYFTQESGDSTEVRAVSWDGSDSPRSPLPSHTDSSSMTRVGSRFAWIRQGFTASQPAVVITDLGADEVWEVDTSALGQSLDSLEFSPAGDQLYFTVDGAPYVVDAEPGATPVPLDDGTDDRVIEGHFSAGFEVIELTACCGTDLDQRRFRAVTVDGPGPVDLPAADGVAAFDINPEGTMAVVGEDGSLRLLEQLGRGGDRAIQVEGRAVDVGF